MIPHYMYLLIVRSHGNPLYTELVRVPKFLWIICLTRFFDYFLSWLTLFYSQWWWFDGFFPYFHPQQSLWCSYGSYGIEKTVRTLICLAPSLVNALKFCFFTKKKKKFHKHLNIKTCVTQNIYPTHQLSDHSEIYTWSVGLSRNPMHQIFMARSREAIQTLQAVWYITDMKMAQLMKLIVPLT